MGFLVVALAVAVFVLEIAWIMRRRTGIRFFALR
jgi:hypothetical protein